MKVDAVQDEDNFNFTFGSSGSYWSLISSVHLNIRLAVGTNPGADAELGEEG